MFYIHGEPLWLSGKVVKNAKINEIERTRVCSHPGQPRFFYKEGYTMGTYCQNIDN
jgi:hypothetical protein